MCQACVDAFDELWPELSDDERMVFLWNCTAFPAGNNTRERLEHYIAKCGKDINAVLAQADADLCNPEPADAAEFFRMVAAADLSSLESVRRFKEWQSEDGTRAGLERLFAKGKRKP